MINKHSHFEVVIMAVCIFAILFCVYLLATGQ